MGIKCETRVRSYRKQHLHGGFWGYTQGHVLSPYFVIMVIDVLTEKVRKEVSESIMFADDVWGGNEVYITEHLESWRKALEERRMSQ